MASAKDDKDYNKEDNKEYNKEDNKDWKNSWTAHDSYLSDNDGNHNIQTIWTNAMAYRSPHHRSTWQWHTQLIAMMSNATQIPEVDHQIVWIVGGPNTGKTWFRKSIQDIKEIKNGGPALVPGNSPLKHLVVDKADAGSIVARISAPIALAKKYGYKSIFYAMCNDAPPNAQQVYSIDTKTGLLIPARFTMDNALKAAAATGKTANTNTIAGAGTKTYD